MQVRGSHHATSGSAMACLICDSKKQEEDCCKCNGGVRITLLETQSWRAYSPKTTNRRTSAVSARARFAPPYKGLSYGVFSL